MGGFCEMQTEWQISFPVVRYFKMLSLYFFAKKIKLCMSFLIDLVTHFMKFYS